MGQVTPDTPAGLLAPAPLGEAHDLSLFDCGRPELDNWLRTHARRSEGRTARTYVACQETRVVGYHCLAMGSVGLKGVPRKFRHGSPDPIPVALLGRLAVDRSWAGRGLGTDLLHDAFMRVAQGSRVFGVLAVLVHAIDDDAREFYLKRAEFIEYPAESRTLFLPIETIVGSL